MIEKNILTKLLALKSVMQQSITQNKETCVAFIDFENAFDKVWSSALFCLLRKRGIRGKF